MGTFDVHGARTRPAGEGRRTVGSWVKVCAVVVTLVTATIFAASLFGLNAAQPSRAVRAEATGQTVKKAPVQSGTLKGYAVVY